MSKYDPINQSILYQNICIYYTMFYGIHIYIIKR